MNRIEFDNMDLLEQVNYINAQLSLGSTLTKICEGIGIGRATVRDRFIKADYTFDKAKNQYLKSIDDKSNIKVVHKVLNQVSLKKPVEYKSNTIVKSKESQYLKEFYSIKDDLLELVKNKDDLLNIIREYKSNTKIIEIPELNINDIPSKLRKDINTRSLKIYDPIYNLFNELCDEYPSIKKQDLISLALLEFFNKYKK